MAYPARWFRSTGSYEPDQDTDGPGTDLCRFRSTGSYEPDRENHSVGLNRGGFDPQALTSLTLRNRPDKDGTHRGFDPQALTSLTACKTSSIPPHSTFRSTGSYEPDRLGLKQKNLILTFRSTGSYEPDRHSAKIVPAKTRVSIHRLLRA